MIKRRDIRRQRAILLRTTVATVATVALLPAAHAESSVTIYGLIDAGVGYANNVEGHSDTFQSTSVMQADRIGLRGTEDLGNGTRAIFVLENGFSLNDGEMGQGGKLFGRQAYVGLTDDRYGTLTLGNQYDYMGATLGMYETSTWLLGQYSDHPLANDRANSQRLANSVEYMTPVWNGFQLGAMYGFSNNGVSTDSDDGANDDDGTGHSASYSISYHSGPWNIAAAYTEVTGSDSELDISSLTGQPTDSVVAGGGYLRTMGLATSYKFSGSFLYAMYTQALYTAPQGTGAPNVMFHNGQVGYTYDITSALTAAAGYTLTTVGAIKLHQVSTALDYALSKRTDVYVMLLGEHAQGDDAHASIIGIGGASGANQVVSDIGMRVKF